MIETIAFDDLGPAAWDAACDRSPDAWLWHTSGWMAYSIAYRLSLRSRNVSFALVEGGEIVGLAQAFSETLPAPYEHTELSFGGDAAWAPVFAPAEPRRRAALWRTVLDHLDDVAVANDAERISIRVSPLVPSFPTYLAECLAATARAGYLDTSAATQVIDLTIDDREVRSQMSKGHRADITRGRRQLEVQVFASASSDADAAFDRYREMHAAAAGRVTRPDVTFGLMKNWIGSGSGVLIGARSAEEWVGFSYLLVRGAAAYYASGANDPASADLPVGHLLQAEAMSWLKQHGVGRYEVGLQQFGPLPHLPADHKEVNISRFKRGFGGVLQPAVGREKYYSARLFRDIARLRAAAYADANWPVQES